MFNILCSNNSIDSEPKIQNKKTTNINKKSFFIVLTYIKLSINE